MDYQRFDWQETDPGKYEREIDEAEQFYASIAKTYEETGHTIFAITAGISLKVSRPVDMNISSFDKKIDDSLRSAWKKVRFDHPTLAAPVVHDTTTKKYKKVYQSPITELELDNWLKESFEIIDDGKTGDEFANTDPPVGPIAKLFIVKPTQDNVDELRRDIVFRSPHHIIDGLGSFYLLNNFLLHASAAFSFSDSSHDTYKFGNEIKNLSPPLRVAADIPHSPTPSQTAKLEETRALNTALGSTPNITTLSLPFSTLSTSPGKSQRTEILLTTSQTRSLISACKERGITPTQAIHSSIALALAELQPATEVPQLGRYISYSLINLRKHCIAPYDSAQHAAAVYHCASGLKLGIDVTIPPQATSQKDENTVSNFSLAISQIHTFSRATLPTPDSLATVPSLFSSVTPPYAVAP